MFWDSKIRQYRNEKGELIPEQDIIEHLIKILIGIAALFASRTNNYFGKKIQFEEWFDNMQIDINSVHRIAGALAYGGFNQMEQEDHVNIEIFLQTQLAYFQNYAVNLLGGNVSEAQGAWRSALYALAGYATYQNIAVLREQKAGMLVYKRIIDSEAENCEDCIEYAFRGWQRIGTLPRIGENCACRSNCRCKFVFSNDISLIK